MGAYGCDLQKIIRKGEYRMNLLNMKFPKLYWIISVALIGVGISNMLIGGIRAKADREKHLPN